MREKVVDVLPLDEPPTHHEVYYKEGSVILVENTLFRIPRVMFELNAPELADLLPSFSAGEERGLTDDTPVHLEDVAAKDFERLLSVIYPIIYTEDYPCALWKSEEWTSVLHLASKWTMKGLRAMAIKNLNTTASAATKVRLGRRYNHPIWVSEGFMNLCLRTDPLTLEEGQELELEDVIGCASAREAIRAKVITLEAGTTMFSSSRLGNVRVRIGKYEDGMKYISNAVVRDIVESTFSVVTEPPSAAG